MSIVEKYTVECLTCNFTYLGKSSRSGYSRVKCMVCGTVDEFRQDNIRAGKVRCEGCHDTKMINECLTCNFTYLGKSSRSGYSRVKCNVCGTEGEFDQGAIRAGRVRCEGCQIAKYKQSAKPSWTFDSHFCDGRQTYVNIKHSCSDAIVKVQVGAYLRGAYDCPHCQISKYKSSAKPGWTFDSHFFDGRQTCVNIKHSCSDTIVKVHVGAYIKGEYSCPHCMQTHFNDPSYFYVIQVGEIIKLGISNRPDQRYTQYGLPEDSTIIEHLRIPLETKRDALVVESHAKQLVRDFKMPTEISKLVFTKAGFNECYSLESLDLLLTI